jgi:hypothetical protein
MQASIGAQSGHFPIWNAKVELCYGSFLGPELYAIISERAEASYVEPT